MILIATLVAIAILTTAGYWWQSRSSSARLAPHPPARAAVRFAAVEIRRQSGACAAAKALGGQRFLANQAPALPLVGCTNKRCDCSFAKLTDRRTEDDRRWGNDGLSASMFIKVQRRKQTGRRDKDSP
jgi:hypothetical protein